MSQSLKLTIEHKHGEALMSSCNYKTKQNDD